MDDTLFPERDYVMSGYRAVSAYLAGVLCGSEDDIYSDLVRIFHGPGRSRAFDDLLSPYGRADLVRECVDVYRGHRPNIKLTQDAQEVLGVCLAHGPVGLVTDGPAQMQQAKVTALRLAELGIHVVLTDTLGGRATWKPNPLGLETVASHMGCDPSDLVYVADNPHKDFMASRRAGMGSVRFRAPWQLHAAAEPLPGGEPESEITSLALLPSLLRI